VQGSESTVYEIKRHYNRNKKYKKHFTEGAGVYIKMVICIRNVVIWTLLDTGAANVK